MVDEFKQPRVLIVDDDDMESFATELELYDVQAQHVTPDELRCHHLDGVDVILVDEYLKVWEKRESVAESIGLHVRDGIALASVLRSHISNRGPNEELPLRRSNTAIVLRTGHLDALAAGIPAYVRSVSVARQNDLEWVVRKGDVDGGGSASAIRDLACAVSQLPAEWHGLDTTGIQSWLSVANKTFCDAALLQIEECRPPWSVLASTSAGRKWISWFLQRILPFPTFLIDDLRAAAYLGLSDSALDILRDSDSEVGKMLAESVYSGELSDFVGRRWWRAGLQEIRRYVISRSGASSQEHFFDTLCHVSQCDLKAYRLAVRYPVFEIDDDYYVVKDPIEIENGVRLQLDEWPSYADFPWLDRRSLSFCSTDLKRLIVIDDRNRGGEM